MSVAGGRLTLASPDRAVERIYREQRLKLWRALLGYTSDPDVASDALAEAFAQALARRVGINDPAAWVWKVAFRVAAGEMQRRRREGGEAPEGSYDFPEPLRDVVDALAHISPNQRLAIVLHDYADRPTTEIAEIMGASRATVHVHLSQGRRRLRRLLEEHDA
jgi:RNA polymerase sigma-70 factor (ECF subfamily)